MANASVHEQPSEVLASERRPWLAQPNELTSAKNSKSSEREDATHDSPSIQMADSILSAPRSTQAPKTIEKAENTKLDEPPRSAKAQKPTIKAQKRKLDVQARQRGQGARNSRLGKQLTPHTAARRCRYPSGWARSHMRQMPTTARCAALKASSRRQLTGGGGASNNLQAPCNAKCAPATAHGESCAPELDLHVVKRDISNNCVRFYI